MNNIRSEWYGNVEIGIFEHNGQEYTALGSVIGENHMTAYLGKDGQLTMWNGDVIGTYHISSTWKTPRSFVSSTMHQVYAVVNGVTYTGRSAGEGMLFRGRKVR